MNIPTENSIYFATTTLPAAAGLSQTIDKILTVQALADYIKGNPQLFHYGSPDYSAYAERYEPTGSLIVKISAVPLALVAVVQLVYHLAKALFYGMYKLCAGESKYFFSAIYHAARDLEQAMGLIVSIIDETRGSYYIQESFFQKSCYSYYESQPAIAQLPNSSKATVSAKDEDPSLNKNKDEDPSLNKNTGAAKVTIISDGPPETQLAFSSICSNIPVAVTGIINREGFITKVKENKWKLEPVIISQSDFVPKKLTEHLMRKKKNFALGIKYVKGDKITNMEGAIHTFMTPICPVTMLGDYVFKGKHGIQRLPGNEGRKVVLSAAIQPDFELAGDQEVVMKIVRIDQEPIQGQPFPDDFETLYEQTNGDMEDFHNKLNLYEKKLQAGMVYSLTKAHRLPSLDEVQGDVKSYAETITLIENLINENLDPLENLEGKFVRLNEHVISLEVLFNIYLHQLKNEFRVLEAMLPQGYVYTINPPAIFAAQIGGVQNVNLLNRLQALAFMQLTQNFSFENLQVIGFSDYSDKQGTSFLQKVFPDKIVVSKDSLFEGGHYSIKENYALVLHNNSDAFGQNIETEGPTSLDGVIGSYSDAACQLKRNRHDLVQHVLIETVI